MTFEHAAAADYLHYCNVSYSNVLSDLLVYKSFYVTHNVLLNYHENVVKLLQNTNWKSNVRF